MRTRPLAESHLCRLRPGSATRVARTRLLRTSRPCCKEAFSSHDGGTWAELVRTFLAVRQRLGHSSITVTFEGKARRVRAYTM